MNELEQLYKNIYPSLKSYVLKLGCNPSVAEELVQETFLIALEHLAVKASPLNHAWFFTVARNLYYNYSKKQSRVSLTDSMESFDGEAAETIDSGLQRDDEEKQVKDILQQLNDDYREILVLREYQNYSYHRIGEELGLTIEQVKITLYRARLRFKQLYERSTRNEV